MWHVTCDMRNVTCGMWHVTHNMWHMTCDTWQVTSDTWCGMNILSKFQLSRSIKTTAATTPGLLIKLDMFSEKRGTRTNNIYLIIWYYIGHKPSISVTVTGDQEWCKSSWQWLQYLYKKLSQASAPAPAPRNTRRWGSAPAPTPGSTQPWRWRCKTKCRRRWSETSRRSGLRWWCFGCWWWWWGGGGGVWGGRGWLLW